MAVINTIASQRFLSLSNSTSTLFKSKSSFNLPSSSSFSCIRIAAVCTTGARRFRPPPAAVSINDGIDVIPVQSGDLMDQLDAIAPLINREGENDESCLDQPGPSASQIVGFAFESRADGGGEGGLAFSSSSSRSGSLIERGDQYKIVDRIINASIVLAAGSFALTKMLTVDSDYWHEKLFCAESKREEPFRLLCTNMYAHNSDGSSHPNSAQNNFSQLRAHLLVFGLSCILCIIFFIIK